VRKSSPSGNTVQIFLIIRLSVIYFLIRSIENVLQLQENRDFFYGNYSFCVLIDVHVSRFTAVL
jgi:hypothetical protein